VPQARHHALIPETPPVKPAFVSTCAAAASLLLAASASAGNLLVNGSFEIGTDPGLFIGLPGGSTAITGWTVGDFEVDYTSSATWNASDGVRSVDLDGNGSQPLNGSLFQSFATTPGQAYRVDFDMSGNIVGAPLLKTMEVSVADFVQQYTFNAGSIVPFVPPLALTYDHHSFVFTATASTSTLRFRSLTQLSGAPGYGVVVDDVQVEPATWTDLGFALPGVAGAPQLVGAGDLTAGSVGSLVLSSAAPSAPALLFIALGSAPMPFKGGTLVPGPVLATLPVVTSAAGVVSIIWPSWPAGLSGAQVHFQYGIKDVAAVHDVSLSNAVRGDVP
jgi:choice-of-anchor C domain-containing protein